MGTTGVGLEQGATTATWLGMPFRVETRGTTKDTYKVVTLPTTVTTGGYVPPIGNYVQQPQAGSLCCLECRLVRTTEDTY